MASPAGLALAVAALAAVHLAAAYLRFLDVIPRSRWLSLAGGVSVAYIFVRLLPELSAGQMVVGRVVPQTFVLLENHVYIIALLGLLVFYGLERVVRESQKRPKQRYRDSTTSARVYWLHILSFALYNLLIGYLVVHRERPGLQSLAFFAVAMGLHFLVTDYGLKKDHRGEYNRTGRWILVGALVFGWTVGILTEVPVALIAVLAAFLAGGVILNVLKEELPAERQSRLIPFFAGALAYTLILLVA
ncbi:MAG: hypothetical protein QMD46_05495 [Methanomicrobiales archaeon]|nr:hypothetical protein [Methanomicrobiales archaeon]MDI6875595.1 hypothetical protein [Methanomicrobiales archaeon]